MMVVVVVVRIWRVFAGPLGAYDFVRMMGS